ncbi:hypothetical protein MRB53_007887 [Persea americana]|uniref:Uncharacterized protein n=1 Tax=Persea americana TaxID=3435 RepID=A0ACC2MLB6_PERAE|nr:hypothetical protein MRB53_007887 [Persea americana]
MTWLLDNPDESLEYILADSGFDVWIANTRGTRWSLKHQSLNPTEPETLIALASFSEGKQVDKLKSAALLTPIACLGHITTVIGQLAAKVSVGEIMSDLLGIPEFNPKEKVVADILNKYCSQPGINCYELLTSITELLPEFIHCQSLLEVRATIILDKDHDASSSGVRNGVIAKFVYVTPEANMAHYSQLKPPFYNLSNIPSDLPLFLSYGGEDALSDVNDVQHLLDNLKFHDADKLTVQFVEDFTHADFDGMTWLLDNPDQSLGYILADRGFDVWIANTRGTRWSNKHQSLDPNNPISFLTFLLLISISSYVTLACP